MSALLAMLAGFTVLFAGFFVDHVAAVREGRR